MYLTGDLARVTSSDNILFLGRIDSQVKVRGYRIELEEIEECLESHPDIKRAKVIVLNKEEKNTKIAAYLICHLFFSSQEDQQQFISEIREFIFNQLPAYMIPSFFIFLDQFPLNINGKIDIKQLPHPSDDEKIECASARNFVENLLITLLKKLLKQQEIGIYDNLFDLGANSLLAITLASEIKHHFNRSIPIIEIFKSPTVLDLAKRIQSSDMREEIIYQIKTGKYAYSPRLFLMHASDGLTFAYSHFLFKDFDFSICCLNHPYFGQEHKTFANLESMARHYIEQIKVIQPQGPYYLGGWSFGGVLAFEMAAQLEEMQQSIGHVFLIDSLVGSAVTQVPHQSDIDEILKHYGIKAGSQENRSFSIEMKKHHLLLSDYRPKVKTFKTTLFKAADQNHYFSTIDLYNGWKDIAKELRIIAIPTNHYEVFSEQESLKILGEILAKTIG